MKIVQPGLTTPEHSAICIGPQHPLGSLLKVQSFGCAWQSKRLSRLLVRAQVRKVDRVSQLPDSIIYEV